MAQKKQSGSSTSSKRKTTSAAEKRTATPKQTTALSTVAKSSDFVGMRFVTLTEKNITVNGKKRFPNNQQNLEVAGKELNKRGIKSVTYRV